MPEVTYRRLRLTNQRLLLALELYMCVCVRACVRADMNISCIVNELEVQ